MYICRLTGVCGGVCVYMCHTGLQVCGDLCTCVTLDYWCLWRFVCIYMCLVGLLVSVEVCVCTCVKLVYSVCFCVCVSMCYVSLQASVEVCVYPLMREAYAEGLMGQ